MLNNQAVDRVFHALGDPTRRAIVERLSRGSASVSDIAGPLEVTLAAVIQHLQVLEDSGIVRTEKVGRVRSCHVQPEGLHVVEQWVSERRMLWERHFDRLAQLLDETEPVTTKLRKRSKT